MEIFDIIPSDSAPDKSHTQHTADTLINEVRALADYLIKFHQRNYSVFWNSPMRPDDILAAMGTRARGFLLASRASVQNIMNLIAVREPDPVFREELIASIFPPETWWPRRELIEHEDGTVTLAPPEYGHDDWGRPLPPPE